VATKIKLMRLGKMRAPYYRIVVADSRTKREGRSIETIGKYHPKEDPSFIEVDSERAQYWLGVGAQPMKVAAPKPDKKALYEEAVRASGEEPAAGATTPRKKAAPQADDAAPAAETPAE
jgi:small subunit ribosomal protein S16